MQSRECMNGKLAAMLIGAGCIGLLGLLLYRQPLAAGNAGLQHSADLAEEQVPRVGMGASDISPVPIYRRGPGQESRPVTNRVVRLLRGEDVPKPSSGELQAFVDASSRSTESLLGAFRATGDRAFLREAMEKAGKDARVALAAYYLERPYNNEQAATPERRKWLDAFKSADPDNALPNLLSARDYFKAGETDKALEEAKAAYLKPGFQDYSVSFIQDAEEAYRAAGYSEAEAKAFATSDLPLPQLAELKRLQQNLLDQSNSFRQAGDSASADAAMQLALNLYQRMQPGKNQFLICDLVGIAMEKQLLSSMDPTSPYGDPGQTVKDRLDQLQQTREAIKGLGKQSEALLPRMTEQDLASFFDRIKVTGEQSAIQWAIKKYAAQ